MKKYSIIKPDPTLRNNLMMWGFMCDEGWFPLIYTTLDKIQEVVDKTGIDLEITEIKEKYGELRIYTSSSTDEIDEIIQEATAKSIHICERCGREGELREIHGWYKTMCEECLKEELGEEKIFEEKHKITKEFLAELLDGLGYDIENLFTEEEEEDDRNLE